VLCLAFRYRIAGFPVRPGPILSARQRQVSAAQPPLYDNQISFSGLSPTEFRNRATR